MHVLFLEIDTESEWAVASLGPAAIAAHLRAQGHDASMRRIPHDMPLDAVADTVADMLADLAPVPCGAPLDTAPSAGAPVAGAAIVGLSLTARQWPRARAVAAALHGRIAAPVVAGGLHPTFAQDEVLAAPGIHAVCVGEGETAMAALCDAMEGRATPLATLDWDRLPNLRRPGGPPPQLAPPLPPAQHPPLARDLLDERHGVVHMSTRRGCPFSCTYCAARGLHRLYGRGYGGRRDVEAVMAELEAMRRAAPLNYIIFVDDTFTLDPDWVAVFCHQFPRRVGVGFSIHARADTVTQDMLRQLARAGCRHVVFGVESGSERVRRDIMRRPMSDAQITQAFAWARDAGCVVTANYMLGLPGETPDEMAATLALNERLAPDAFGWFVYQPYAGTELGERCLADGLAGGAAKPGPDAGPPRRSILALPDTVQDAIEQCCMRFETARAARAATRTAPTGGR
ncbi:MAG: radical SAM protein [Desulfovibrionaceae bacterium]